MTGVELINEERDKQINKYGYDAKHDLEYKDNQLMYAALSYLSCAIDGRDIGVYFVNWPFDVKFFKNEGKIDCLKKAGAFIAAELDRLQEEESL